MYDTDRGAVWVMLQEGSAVRVFRSDDAGSGSDEGNGNGNGHGHGDGGRTAARLAEAVEGCLSEGSTACADLSRDPSARAAALQHKVDACLRLLSRRFGVSSPRSAKTAAAALLLLLYEQLRCCATRARRHLRSAADAAKARRLRRRGVARAWVCAGAELPWPARRFSAPLQAAPELLRAALLLLLFCCCRCSARPPRSVPPVLLLTSCSFPQQTLVCCQPR